jgi:hypothetical protein
VKYVSALIWAHAQQAKAKKKPAGDKQALSSMPSSHSGYFTSMVDSRKQASDVAVLRAQVDDVKVERRVTDSKRTAGATSGAPPGRTDSC